MTALEEFARELQRPNPLPERLALAISAIAYPELESEHFLHEMDRLAQQLSKRLALLNAPTQRAQHFLMIFCEELGFSGNREDYYHPDNSYLNHVLEKRRGLPIMLCLICVALARRINLPIDGIGFPGHFMARFQDAHGSWLLDPFNNEIVAPKDAERYLGRIIGVQPTLDEESYRPISAEAWAQRILFNLRNAYLGSRNPEMTIQVLDYLLILMPNHPVLWRERGLLHHQNGEWLDAVNDLRRSFFLFGQFALVLGDEQQRLSLIAALSPEEKRIAQLYLQTIQQLAKLN